MIIQECQICLKCSNFRPNWRRKNPVFKFFSCFKCRSRPARLQSGDATWKVRGKRRQKSSKVTVGKNPFLLRFTKTTNGRRNADYLQLEQNNCQGWQLLFSYPLRALIQNFSRNWKLKTLTTEIQGCYNFFLCIEFYGDPKYFYFFWFHFLAQMAPLKIMPKQHLRLIFQNSWNISKSLTPPSSSSEWTNASFLSYIFNGSYLPSHQYNMGFSR